MPADRNRRDTAILALAREIADAMRLQGAREPSQAVMIGMPVCERRGPDLDLSPGDYLAVVRLALTLSRETAS